MKKDRIEICDLKREYDFLKKEILSQIQPLFKTHHWVLGEKLAEFEKKAARFLGCRYALGVSSGTDALVLALQALAKKLKKKTLSSRDEIITTPFTFIATGEAILRVGARPVFVDIDPQTFNLDPLAVKKAISKNTVGILPVHLYGLPADMKAIMDIAKVKGILVVEDCAQSFGAEINGRKTGSFGLLGCFSFFPSKNLGAYGDGGMVVTNDYSLFKYLKALRNHGQTKPYRAEFLGYNCRLDSFQAAVLLAKLKHINYLNSLRKKKAACFNRRLSHLKQIVVPPSAGHIYHLYTIKVSSRRDGLLKFLNKHQIEARVYYPYLLSKMKAFRSAKATSLRNAPKACRQVLSLPLYPFIKTEEINYICDRIGQFFSSKV